MLASNLEGLVEDSFYLSYHAGIQPSEVDKLSTYEFNKYMDLLNKQVDKDREFDKSLAQVSGGLGKFIQ